MQKRKALDVEINKVKNMRGRIKGYLAKLPANPDERQTEIEGRGETPKEACADLQTRLARLPNVTGTMPQYRTIGLYVLIIVPETDGTRTFLVHPGSLPLSGVPHVSESTTGETDFNKIEAQARIHVAQMTYNPKDASTEAPALAVLRDEKQIGEFMPWLEWQKRYHILRLAGYADIDAHAITSGHPSYPTFADAVRVKERERIEQETVLEKEAASITNECE